MKKIAKLMTALALMAFAFTSCEDVPSPFGAVAPPDNTEDNGGGELPYSSTNLKTGWALVNVTADQPWSQGSSYVQATGYQKWDGASEKSNRAVEGWLISPSISTKGYENVKLSFDHTIKYTNNVSGWEANHKVFASSNYDESNPTAATWVEITTFKPVASPYSDWTLYSSGELQLPAEMTGKDAIHIGFLFKAPANASTTWELKNFNIEEGIADNNGDSGEDDPVITDNDGTEAKPYTVSEVITVASKEKVYVKGYIVGYIADKAFSSAELSANATVNTNIILAASADETSTDNCIPIQLPNGAIRSGLNLQDNAGNYKKEVLLYGDITTYFGKPGVKNVSYAVIDGKEIGSKPGSGETPTPTDDVQTVTVAQFNAAAESTSVWYKLTGTVKNLKDGDIYGNFDLEDETGSVYVYGLLAEKGGEKKKFQELVAAKGIKEGSKITIIGNRGSYQNKIEVMNAYFVSIESGDTPGGGDTPSGSTGLEADFTSGEGNFTIENKEIGSLSFVWKADSKGYMKASAYVNSANNAAESWLVSPAFSLKGVSAPVMTFNNACNFVKEGTITDHIKVMVYDGTNWAEATIANMPDGKSWTFVDSSVDLKSIANKEGVKIAFKYVSTTAVAPTWEIKTVSIK